MSVPLQVSVPLLQATIGSDLSVQTGPRSISQNGAVTPSTPKSGRVPVLLHTQPYVHSSLCSFILFFLTVCNRQLQHQQLSHQPWNEPEAQCSQQLLFHPAAGSGDAASLPAGTRGGGFCNQKQSHSKFRWVTVTYQLLMLFYLRFG